MSASMGMWAAAHRFALGAGVLALAAAAACATTSVGAGADYGMPDRSRLNGASELVGAATLALDSTSAPVALRAASVLVQAGWPVALADSATGVLISGWQYFEPTAPVGLGSPSCDGGMAMRLFVRPLPDRMHGIRLSAEAVVPARVDRAQALSYARSVLASFRSQVAALKEPLQTSAGPHGSLGFARMLTDGHYRVCGNIGT